MEYDELSRLKVKRSGATNLATYQYDDTSKSNCLGRLSKITDQNGNISSYYYDSEGRTVKLEKTIGGTTYITQTAYDLIGRTTSISYPDNAIVYYLYDQNSGLLEAVSDSTEISGGTAVSDTAYVKRITYNAKGQIKTITYGNGVQTNYHYGNDLRLSQIFTQKPGSPALQDLNYTFDDNGNIIQLVDNLRSNIRTYEYDDLNRLTTAENTPAPNGGYVTFHYQYDSIGNMTNKEGVQFYYGEAKGLSPQGTVPITAPHAVTTAGSNSYSYDPNGNMLAATNKLMAYDVENRMISLETSIGTTLFTYDTDGSRIKKQTGANYTLYINSLFEKDQAGKTTKYIFAGANRVCSIESTGNTYYYHGDHLGSSNIITDSTGALIQHCEYTPYGTIATNEGTDVVTHKFTGKELDSTGLYFYAWRYYDPELGRFCQPDTIIPEPYNPQTLNRYSYCDNNPLNYTDPTGHKSWWHKLVDTIISAVVTVAINVIGAAIFIATLNTGCPMGFFGYYDQGKHEFEGVAFVGPIGVYGGKKDGEWYVNVEGMLPFGGSTGDGGHPGPSPPGEPASSGSNSQSSSNSGSSGFYSYPQIEKLFQQNSYSEDAQSQDLLNGDLSDYVDRQLDYTSSGLLRGPKDVVTWPITLLEQVLSSTSDLLGKEAFGSTQALRIVGYGSSAGATTLNIDDNDAFRGMVIGGAFGFALGRGLTPLGPAVGALICGYIGRQLGSYSDRLHHKPSQSLAW